MTDRRVTLIGAGLAGSLLAIYLARRGYGVDIYERRPDMRRVNIGGGRSINLALSTRGLHALREVGLHDEIMRIAIPMRGRMIHALNGTLTFQRYGKDDTEVIYATSRANLNMALMTAAESFTGVGIHFNRRCTGMNLHSGEVTLFDETTGMDMPVRSDVVIGTDGSASAVRMEMQRSVKFNFSQQYLDYGYKELEIPPGPAGAFQMEKNALHIWPRGTYMLIALPNIDGSFTCTLFLPFEGDPSFAGLSSVQKLTAFFTTQFPDAVTLMPALVRDFFENPTGSMVTIKCSPWHAGGRALLLGDAAHAIVPFFGQGMNCAFEDCTVLNEILGTQAGSRDWEGVFRQFERLRKENTDAIADLAVENFVEMRDLVASPAFQLKKNVERLLEERFPSRFIPKYSMVTFHRLPYALALTRGKAQDTILTELSRDIRRPEDIDWAKAESLLQELPPLFS